MSTMEQDGQAQAEQRSSVKITTNAKLEAQVEIKVYDTTGSDELERIRALAVKAYSATMAEVRRAA